MQATIEQTIERVEQLFMALTGRRPADVDERRAAIPPEIDPFVHVERQLARMMTSFGKLASRMSATPGWTPRAVTYRDELGTVLLVDVPGVSRDQLDITVAGNQMTVSGYRTPTTSHGEIPWGAFARTFAIPAPIAPEQVDAHLEHGVLSVRITQGQKRGTTSQVSVSS